MEVKRLTTNIVLAHSRIMKFCVPSLSKSNFHACKVSNDVLVAVDEDIGDETVPRALWDITVTVSCRLKYKPINMKRHTFVSWK